MSHTTENKLGLHIFVFCSADHKDIVEDCIKSIDSYVTDVVLSKNIVSNITININGWNLIKDLDFWALLDPEFKYRNLYNHNWVKQQIFKLNLDKFVNGNILVVDAETRFVKPIQWLVNTRQHLLFYARPIKCLTSAEFVKKAINVKVDTSKNFITEAIIFSTDILKEIRDKVEKTNLLPQLSAYQCIVFDDHDPIAVKANLNLFMSEYILYANYLLQYHPEKIFELVNVDEGFFYQKETDFTSYTAGNKTTWVTFYEQVKDTSWPNCESEDDFYKLPTHIQNECINTYGYQPRLKNN